MSLALSIMEIVKSERARFIAMLEADSIVEFASFVNIPPDTRRNTRTITRTQEHAEHFTKVFAFEQKILEHQRIFCAINKETGKPIATAFVFPLVLEGELFPKFAKAAKRASHSLPSANAYLYWAWIELRILDPALKGQGIGSAFTKKLFKSEKFKLAESFTTIVGKLNTDNPSAVGLLASLGGHALFTFGNQCFARVELRR